MTPYCANTITKHGTGCEEIPQQGRDICNSRKLRKVAAIHKINKLVLSKKSMSLKTRGSEKVSLSKSSCFRLILCYQLIKSSMFLVSLLAVINTEERTLTASPCVAVIQLT